MARCPVREGLFRGREDGMKKEASMLKHGILGLLNYGPTTGYEIMLVFRDSLDFFWSAQTSQIYRELQALESKGWATKTIVVQEGKPDKNVYAITEQGRQELVEWLLRKSDPPRVRNDLLMRAFFLGELADDEAEAFFLRCIEERRSFLESLDGAKEAIEVYEALLDDPAKARYWAMTLDYGYRMARAEIEWAEDCIEGLGGHR